MGAKVGGLRQHIHDSSTKLGHDIRNRLAIDQEQRVVHGHILLPETKDQAKHQQACLINVLTRIVTIPLGTNDVLSGIGIGM